MEAGFHVRRRLVRIRLESIIAQREEQEEEYAWTMRRTPDNNKELVFPYLHCCSARTLPCEMLSDVSVAHQ